jgi:superfamily II DNA/RNA helicase
MLLITTDDFARHLDIPSVTLVIHYDIPSKSVDYVLRVGRKRHFGAGCISILFATSEEKAILHDIES